MLRTLRALSLAVLPLLAACTTMVHARGEWGEPVVPPLPEKALAGRAVAVLCGAGNYGEAAWHVASEHGCQDIVRILRSMGAEVHAPPGLMPPPRPGTKEAEVVSDEALDSSAADGSGKKAQVAMTVTYIERGNTWHGCWWTFPLVVMTSSLFPCFIEWPTHAEIRLAGGDGAVSVVQPLDLEARTVVGLGAFYYMRPEFLGLSGSKAERRRHNKSRLLAYIQGLIYSFDQRQRLSLSSSVGGAL